jgi:tripeptide aminopeptidase
MNNDLELLKNVLSVPTATYHEDRLVEFICDWLKEQNIPYVVDEMQNIYATKTSEEFKGKPFPCMVAHTDTVHKLNPIHIREEMLPNEEGIEKLSLRGYTEDGKYTGIGGDDKCGVFGAMISLRDLPHVKGAFFVSEETGCWGSRKADPNFFDDVAYAIQLDAPSNYMVTEVCSGIRLFERDSDFFRKVDEVLDTYMPTREYMVHPYTDVSQLKMKFDFSCINISCGYYNYHRPSEYVVVEDLSNSIHTSHAMIDKLGYEKYHYEFDNDFYKSRWYDF